ncbi:Uracil-DNA glycosylase, family 1 [Enhygromyxa salina]|uniref:Uracil-DNA glycosylase n=1 Tax=Enhygromyxa salina TaxID=215803 RepID=A0A0C2D9F6_9BACT|nr:uracil-DNA glycosylase [Enhygromyxa salina]KIG18215.1 Uracil-DNA glycosylase, family 1 [Enhygromyxa salina]
MSEAFGELPPSWHAVLGDELAKPYFRKLESFVATARATQEVFPPAQEVFAAFEHTPFESVRVMILGQDPYHDNDQAHGLCFSVRRGVKIPPSLRNLYKELKTDVGIDGPDHGYLQAWAERGVMLLNTVLTVQAHKANSHRKKGWETFSDRVIEVLAAREDPLVFVLWGKPAQKKLPLIERAASHGHHEVILAAHPSPLSASSGFFGSKPFSKVNAALSGWGKPPIDWSLPD